MNYTSPLVIGTVLLVIFAGCIGAGPRTPTASQTGAQTSITEFDTYVFDGGGTDAAVIDGGITSGTAGSASRYYVTHLTSQAHTSRFDESVLDEKASAFVAATDFTNESLVVVQAFPASSIPDYRVETLTRQDNTLSVRINDSSTRATTDITVETLLIRVPTTDRGPPDRVTVTTDDGFTVDSSAGVVTATPRPTDDGSRSVTLPYASDTESENVDEPRDVTIRNSANNTNGYHLVVSATETPACQDETPPCGQPSEDVTILDRWEKLPPNGNATVEDVVAKRGTYRVTVEADVPAGGGSRTTIREEFEWELSADSGDLVLVISNEDISVGYRN